MTAISNYLENLIINHTLRATGTLPSPATVYVALFTTDPTDAGSGTEVAGGSYARTAVTFSAPVNGVTSNSGTINFPAATAGWGTVTHIGIMDAAAAGNLLYHGQLTSARVVNNGDTFTIPAGNLSVTLS